MPDLFAPDPEHHAPAPPQPAKPPAPAWVTGLKSGLLTALKFLCTAAMIFIMIVGFMTVGGGVHQANMKIDKIQRKLDDLEKKREDKKPDDKQSMPPAD